MNDISSQNQNPNQNLPPKPTTPSSSQDLPRQFSPKPLSSSTPASSQDSPGATAPTPTISQPSSAQTPPPLTPQIDKPVTPQPTPPPPPTPTPPPPPASPPLEDIGDEEKPGLTPSKIPRDDIGVGRPNIGVELDDKKTPENPPDSGPAPNIPFQKLPAQPVPPSSQESDEDTIEISSPPQISPRPALQDSTLNPPPKPVSSSEDATMEKPEEKIEISRSDTAFQPQDKPVTDPLKTSMPPHIPPSEHASPVPVPPIKASKGPAASIIAMTIGALILGGAGGFFGFRYFDRLKTSASVETSPTATEILNADPQLWPTYSSAKYSFSLKYPTGWPISTEDPQTDTIVIAKNQASLEGNPTSFKIEIVFQNNQGQTLKSWVEANSASSGEKQAINEISVDNQTVYQQTLENQGPKVATYIDRGEKIMIITYSAPEEIFGQGGDWYNKIINSIDLK